MILRIGHDTGIKEGRGGVWGGEDIPCKPPSHTDGTRSPSLSRKGCIHLLDQRTLPGCEK